MARLVSACVLLRLECCNAILTGLPSSTLAPLQRVQNAAARLVLDLKPWDWDHLTLAYHQLHWLPVQQRIEYKLCLLTHLAVTGKSPAYLTALLTMAKSRGSTSRSADRGDMFIPRTRLRQGEQVFSVSAPRQWNRWIVYLLRAAVFRTRNNSSGIWRCFCLNCHSPIVDILKPF